MENCELQIKNGIFIPGSFGHLFPSEDKKMIVYSIIYHRYNETEFKGVFSTKEKAEEYINSKQSKFSHYFHIIESNLDEEVQEYY